MDASKNTKKPKMSSFSELFDMTSQNDNGNEITWMTPAAKRRPRSQSTDSEEESDDGVIVVSRRRLLTDNETGNNFSNQQKILCLGMVFVLDILLPSRGQGTLYFVID